MENLLCETISENQKILNELSEFRNEFNKICEVCCETLNKQGKIIACGNGGSAADSQHFVGELMGRFLKDREPIPAISLSADTSVLTCISNDYGFEHIFSRQIEGIGKPEDVLFVITTSGKSSNILRALDAGSDKKMKKVGLLGGDGGYAKGLCDYSIVIPSFSTPRIQECQMMVIHAICEAIENNIGLLKL